MNNTYTKLLTEEVNKNVDRLNIKNPNQITEVLKELFFLNTQRLLDNISPVEMDSKNGIAQENWDWLMDTMADSISENQDEWLKAIKEIKEKILTNKYFSKKDMIGTDALEGYLRTEVKTYWSALQNYTSLEDFKNKVFNMPTDILFALVRYLFKVSPELAKAVKVTNDDLKKRIDVVTKLRMKVAKRIGQLSNGYQNVLDMKEVKELFDNGIISEDNFINRGICEYIMKLLNHEGAAAKLKDMFPSSMMKDIKAQIEASPSYIAHVASLRDETGREYFSTKGEQIGKRFENEIEAVESNKLEDYVVDKNSRLKEPNERMAQPPLPWEQGGSAPAGGEDGAGASGGFGSSGGSGAGGLGGSPGGTVDMGGINMGGDFAPPGSEGEIPGEEGTEGDESAIGKDEDGTPMPAGEDGLPTDFGTVEDNGGETEGDTDTTTDTSTEKKPADKK